MKEAEPMANTALEKEREWNKEIEELKEELVTQVALVEREKKNYGRQPRKRNGGQKTDSRRHKATMTG